MLIPSPSSIISAYASISALIFLFTNTLNQLVPHHLQQLIVSFILHFFRRRSPAMSLVVEEYDDIGRNEIYDAAETYLCNMVGYDVERLRIHKQPDERNPILSFAGCETIPDSFHGVDLSWRFFAESMDDIDCEEDDDEEDSERRYFELSFDKKHMEEVMDSYIPHVIGRADAIRGEKKTVRLHDLDYVCFSGYVAWNSVNLEHPSTFDTLAMDSELKKDVIEDLDRFMARKDFYRKVGKAWKRGYLIYGPPGTGKSSLIAAMASHLKFDIYDLQLRNIYSDSDLRKVLLSTSNRSMIVIEDIDCSLNFSDRRSPRREDHPVPQKKSSRRKELHRFTQFSLGGLLNFIDGLWSRCGEEKIIVFTTNNKDKLDPALLRPGRMDKHIPLTHLTINGFRTLAFKYFNIKPGSHRRFEEIEELIASTNVTPAEVTGELMESNDANVSLGGLVEFLTQKKITADNKIKVDGSKEIEKP